ncbi:MAG TPA: hypothetical protein EYG73_08065 [Arcobacter sp.]|nr:hypothetical protein [Arcobacter sp.]
MLKIPKEDEELLIELIQEKRLSKELIFELVGKAVKYRYETRPIGFQSDVSDLITEYANSKKELN